MEQTCENCLNAYNSPHDGDVHCCNREWRQQFEPHLRTTAARNETCFHLWQLRQGAYSEEPEE